MTIFIRRAEGETAADAAREIESALIQFCGTQYRRVEPVFREGEPFWSYNVVVCDDDEQFVPATPLMHPWTRSVFGMRDRPVRFAGPS
ncbi:MAG: hypothetical protein IPI85_16035 [Dehalococcoidia bacterium]|nr:hypothetical protein [Dehalococcoidia bacterium]